MNMNRRQALGFGAAAAAFAVTGFRAMPASASAEDAEKMAESMKLAVQAGRLSFEAGRMPKRLYASASSPLAGVVR